jgi:NDP-sugar pyrophosphorylase family protein
VNSEVHHPNHLTPAQENLPALLLVGGLGTRLQSILPATPKPLARVGKAPFLQLLIRQLAAHGIRNLIMCSGHLAEQIEAEFGNGNKLDVNIRYSNEPSPLGTGGALRFAEKFLQDAPAFILMNGDSFLEMDFSRFLQFHAEHNGMVSMAVRRVPNASRYGTVRIDSENRVLEFAEKTGKQEPGLINGGVYVFDRSILQQTPDGPCSLEKDVFPRILQRGVYASEQNGIFIDIGTPEDYARAQTLSEKLNQAALSEAQN